MPIDKEDIVWYNVITEKRDDKLLKTQEEGNAMKIKVFEEWVKEMIEKYQNDKNVQIRRYGYKTYICYNRKTQKTGIARCHPGDTFDIDIGMAIAYARCKGYEMPEQKIYKKLSEMKNGDKFCAYGTYLFIGVCTNFENEIGYCAQNTRTKKFVLLLDNTQEYEMVD